MQHDNFNYKKRVSSRRILAYEEDKTNQFLLKRVLMKNGYEADVVNNASEVLNRLTTHNERYDLLIINICAPLKDDLELVRTIRSLSNQHISSIPVLATCTAIHPDIKKMCQAQGIVDVIMKPFDIEKLLKLVEESIGGSNTNLIFMHSTDPVS